MRPLFLRETFIAKMKSWPLLSAVALMLVSMVLAMLHLVNPLEIGPNGILVFFFLLYLLGVVSVVMACKGIRYIFKLRTSNIKAMYLAATVAFAPVMLLALNTLNQLEVVDLILVVVFEGLALFYIFRRLE